MFEYGVSVVEKKLKTIITKLTKLNRETYFEELCVYAQRKLLTNRQSHRFYSVKLFL